MEILTICIPLVIAIFAMAYPLAINEIGSINSKYGSERIVEVFRKELEWRWFNNLLYISLLLIALYVCGRVFSFSTRWMHVIIWTIFISTSFLSLLLILFVKKVFIYKSDILLRDYLLKLDNGTYKFKEELLELYVYFIRKDKVITDNELWMYFSTYFHRLRSESANSNEPLVFSRNDYDIIWKLHRVVMESDQNQTVLLQYNASAGEWFIGRHEYYSRISEDTFNTIWNSLSNAISNNKSYIAVKFFMIVYDYFEHIPEILADLDDGGLVTNDDEIARRLDERQDVIDFISVLGGLLYFNNKLKDVGTIFYYTQSQPPNYKAFLPATIRQCLQLYCKLCADEHGRYSLIDVDYPFPALTGIGESGKVLGNTFKFIILEYIRLFTLHSYFHGYDPLSFTGLNENEVNSFNEFKSWFRERLVEFLNDPQLLKAVFDDREFTQDPLTFFDRIDRHYQVV
ncbi:hypothetical protein CHU00_15750 [Sphingobacterium cellulitidis]|uniref:hypothetical protein n=1 Tax=Sphingobacterium cellulitidis TaxID=1768011 RepID=UPI000B9F4E3D|nr:hypothetical protein [Sphingobacterium cellulitidis]OYD44647.1 hypothetical protein CHU00_15750 [Sphingobacterium cellulitidis]